MLFFSTLAIALSAVSVATAAAVDLRSAPEGRNAITFSYPTTRDYLESGSGPCGNPNARSNPDAFPMSGGAILLELVRDMSNVTFAFAPTAEAGNATAFRELLPTIRFLYPGTSCNQAPDWSTLGFFAGDAITIQTTGRGGRNNNQGFTCTDVVLTANDAYTRPPFECVNTVSSVSINGPGNQDPSRSTGGGSTASTGTDQPVSPLQAGFIGACVVIALAVLASGVLYFTGIKFGKKHRFNKQSMLSTTQSRSDDSSFHSTQKA